jgi:hypothetical protein
VGRILILVEGQTEEIVVRDVIAPALLPDVWLEPVLLMTKRPAGGPSFKGGVSNWKKIETDIRLLLRDSSVRHVTTLLDYYGLPSDCPGMSTRPIGSPYERVAHVEEQMRSAIGESRFMPHLVLHETETWVFAAAQQLGELLAAYPGYNKTQDGPLAIAQLGLDNLRSQCPHLDSWLRRLCGEQSDVAE